MRLAFKIALRFLRSSRGQTVLIAVGIAVGVSVQVFIGALIQGLQKSLVNTTIGNSSQITILSNNEDRKIKEWKSIVQEVIRADSRITKISVASDSSAFVKKNKKVEPVLVRGFTFDEADKIYNIKKNIMEGTIPKTDKEVLMGKELKDGLEFKIGDTIDIVKPDGKNDTLKISGFYDLKVSSLNKAWLFVTLKTSQDMFGSGDTITSVEMQINESQIFKADEIGLNVKEALNNSELDVQNWKTQNASLLSGLNGQSVSSYMIQVFVMIAVVLGIASVLAITVLQKSRQIGILKAMGIKDSTASLIFLFQGLLLGIFGAVLGILLGVLLLLMFMKFAVNPDGTPVVVVYISSNFIAVSGLIAIGASVIAALIPARRSSKLNPIEVIRNA